MGWRTHLAKSALADNLNRPEVGEAELGPLHAQKAARTSERRQVTVQIENSGLDRDVLGLLPAVLDQLALLEVVGRRVVGGQSSLRCDPPGNGKRRAVSAPVEKACSDHKEAMRLRRSDMGDGRSRELEPSAAPRGSSDLPPQRRDLDVRQATLRTTPETAK